jgi:hypothetical protein
MRRGRLFYLSLDFTRGPVNPYTVWKGAGNSLEEEDNHLEKRNDNSEGRLKTI